MSAQGSFIAKVLKTNMVGDCSSLCSVLKCLLDPDVPSMSNQV